MELKIDIWSDCVCPYCYAGKRNLETALNSFAHKESVKIEWHSYQLHPELGENESISYYEFMSDKLGISEDALKERLNGVMQMAKAAGLDYRLEEAKEYNTFNAHRIIHKAKEKGVADQMEEAIFKAFFIEGKNLANTQILTETAMAAGLNSPEIEDALLNDKYYSSIWSDFNEADKREVELVPTFFLSDGSKILASPEPEVFLEAIEKAWKNLNP